MRPDEQVRERRGCGSDGPEGRPVSVLTLDIVGFTEINGSLGAVCVARRVSNPLAGERSPRRCATARRARGSPPARDCQR